MIYCAANKQEPHLDLTKINIQIKKRVYEIKIRSSINMVNAY